MIGGIKGVYYIGSPYINCIILCYEEFAHLEQISISWLIISPYIVHDYMQL